MVLMGRHQEEDPPQPSTSGDGAAGLGSFSSQPDDESQDGDDQGQNQG